MKFKREDAICCLGKAEAGKTWFIKRCIEKMPPGMAYIFDYNRNDFLEFKDTQNLWLNNTGSVKEVETFLTKSYKAGNNITVMEEADNYLSEDTPTIRQFVTTARNRGIGMMVSCKRAKSVRPQYRTRFTYLILFHNDLIDDIEYIAQWIGIYKEKDKYAEFETTLRGLELKGEYITVDLVNSTISGVKKL